MRGAAHANEVHNPMSKTKEGPGRRVAQSGALNWLSFDSGDIIANEAVETLGST